MSGKTARRDGLQAALAALNSGDQLMVPAFDRLGRNQRGLLDIAQELDGKGVALRSLREDIDTIDPLLAACSTRSARSSRSLSAI